MAKGETYDEFVDKFKPKLTTDDCFTPDNIYSVVAEYVKNRYNLPRETFVRPFWPGGGYEKYQYPDGCVVVDNPPFSILSKIIKFYNDNGIKFFLFAPALTLINANRMKNVTSICVGGTVTYSNGAKINTSFITNMENDTVIRTDCALFKAMESANKENEIKIHKKIEKYKYPQNVLTAAMMNYYSAHDTEYSVNVKDCKFIYALDDQRENKKTIFGGGYLLSTKAAA